MPKQLFKSVFSQLGLREVIYVNLSSDNLKFAYARITPKKKEIINLSSYNIQGLPDEDISKIVKTYLTSLKLREPEVINIISAHSTITKNIEIPSQDSKEIEDIIKLQASRHTPYSREEIIIGYINIGTYRKHYTKILLIIVTLSLVRRQIEILEKANLKVENIYFAPELMSQISPKIFKQEITDPSLFALVHVDMNFSDFIVTSKGKLIFTRSIPVGVQQLTNEKERFQVRFAEEVKISLEAYTYENIDKAPQELIFTGAIEENQDLKSALNEKLGIAVKFVSYFKNMNIAAEILKDNTLLKNTSFLDVVSPLIATVKIEANFIPEEIKLRKLFEEKSKDLVRTGVFIMIIFALVCSILVSKIYFKTTYLNNLKQKYQSVTESAKGIEKSFSRVEAVKYYLKNRGMPLEVLGELYTIIPNDLRLKDIRLSPDGRLTLSGNAKTMATVFSFISNMEESQYFESVETKRTTKRKELNEELVDFEIVCNVSKPGKAAVGRKKK